MDLYDVTQAPNLFVCILAPNVHEDCRT